MASPRASLLGEMLPPLENLQHLTPPATSLRSRLNFSHLKSLLLESMARQK